MKGRASNFRPKRVDETTLLQHLLTPPTNHRTSGFDRKLLTQPLTVVLGLGEPLVTVRFAS